MLECRHIFHLMVYVFDIFEVFFLHNVPAGFLWQTLTYPLNGNVQFNPTPEVGAFYTVKLSKRAQTYSQIVFLNMYVCLFFIKCPLSAFFSSC